MKDDKNAFPLSKIPSNKTRPLRVVDVPQSSSAPATGAEEEFIAAAKTHTVPSSEPAQEEWRFLDPAELPTRGINVRFNEYELAVISAIAKRQGRSKHQVIKRLLFPEALKELNE